MPCAALSAGARDGLMAVVTLLTMDPSPTHPPARDTSRCLVPVCPVPTPTPHQRASGPCDARAGSGSTPGLQPGGGGRRVSRGLPTLSKARKSPKILAWFVPCPLAAHPAAVLLSLTWLRKVPHGVVAVAVQRKQGGA